MKTNERKNVLDIIYNEGFDYTFNRYSDFKEIKDPIFHKLRKIYLKSQKDLLKYLKQSSQRDVGSLLVGTALGVGGSYVYRHRNELLGNPSQKRSYRDLDRKKLVRRKTSRDLGSLLAGAAAGVAGTLAYQNLPNRKISKPEPQERKIRGKAYEIRYDGELINTIPKRALEDTVFESEEWDDVETRKRVNQLKVGKSIRRGRTILTRVQ